MYNCRRHYNNGVVSSDWKVIGIDNFVMQNYNMCMAVTGPLYVSENCLMTS